MGIEIIKDSRGREHMVFEEEKFIDDSLMGDKTEDFETQLPVLIKNGVTELTIVDENLSKNKKRILKIINLLAQKAPDLFVSILVDASVIDREVAAAATQIFISFDIPLVCQTKGGKILFDKKFYANKARVLNDFGLVFGFQLTYGIVAGDTLKAFTDRLDFAIQQYPNHLDFPQTEKDAEGFEPQVTGIFSAKDIRYCRDMAFAARTFYSSGRAVPWFLSVLKPLKIYPSKFFADFAEWQRCNNCDFKSGYLPEGEKHQSIEKMQLLFLNMKCEEKNCTELEVAVGDIIKINGAMSRLVGESEESVIETSYHPEDLLSPEACDLAAFVENVYMEPCKVRIFLDDEGPNFELQNS